MSDIMSVKETVIELNDVWKRYGLPLLPFLRRQLHRTQGKQLQREAYGPWALREINLSIKQGDALGIIGRNGAGKSTLLKLLAGVSPTTHGTLMTKGRIFPMIELNAGLNTELTGYENIEILSAIMGLRHDMLQERIPRIAEFSELGDWLERPVRTYSSGMKARLGFSVAINVDADILLLDEVLSVGDVAFQKKCPQVFRRLGSLCQQGRVYKKRAEDVGREVARTAVSYQNGILFHETRAHETGMAALWAERQLLQLRRENAAMRQRLAHLHFDLQPRPSRAVAPAVPHRAHRCPQVPGQPLAPQLPQEAGRSHREGSAFPSPTQVGCLGQTDSWVETPTATPRPTPVTSP